MADAKIVICADEKTGKSIAAQLKKSTGGGYKTVEGPFKTDSLLVETFGLDRDSMFEFTDNSDAETWFVVARS
jgi:hypothetical protein